MAVDVLGNVFGDVAGGAALGRVDRLPVHPWVDGLDHRRAVHIEQPLDARHLVADLQFCQCVELVAVGHLELGSFGGGEVIG
ncbi:hypothetical protein D3C75_1206330 [compost metagenome]